MKVIEVIQRVQSLYSAGVQSDDSRLTNRHIYNKLISVYNQLLLEKINKNQKLSEKYYSIIDCMDIVEDDPIKCNCYFNIDCKLYRTACIIPEIMQVNNKYLIDSVTSIDGYEKFNFITFENLKYLDGNKYTARNKWYFLKDNYIYLLNNKKIRSIRIKAIFKDFIKAQKYNCEKNEIKDKCIDVYNLDFPAEEGFIEIIIANTVKELVDMFLRIPQDTTNESKDIRFIQTKK